jgi:hypothetical protein
MTVEIYIKNPHQKINQPIFDSSLKIMEQKFLSINRPLITPTKLHLPESTLENDWHSMENHDPNLSSNKTSTDGKKNRKSLIPVLISPTISQPNSGIRLHSSFSGGKILKSNEKRSSINFATNPSMMNNLIAHKKSLLSEFDGEVCLFTPFSEEIISRKEHEEEVNKLQQTIRTLEHKVFTDEQTLQAQAEQLEQKENLLLMLQEEMYEYKFFIGLQAQKIEEEETHCVHLQIDHRETMSTKHRKYKQNLLKMKEDHMQYEKNATFMIKQINDQMSELQKFAMTRIQVNLSNFFLSLLLYSFLPKYLKKNIYIRHWKSN